MKRVSGSYVGSVCRKSDCTSFIAENLLDEERTREKLFLDVEANASLVLEAGNYIRTLKGFVVPSCCLTRSEEMTYLLFIYLDNGHHRYLYIHPKAYVYFEAAHKQLMDLLRYSPLYVMQTKNTLK